MKTINHFVNGKSFTGNSKKVGKVFNPAGLNTFPTFFELPVKDLPFTK